MGSISIVDDLTVALHSDPNITRRVGGRVAHESKARDVVLPDIVVDAVEGEYVAHAPARQIRITCRAKTPSEADKVGNAVVTALSNARLTSEHIKLVTLADRSGYDSTSGAFRRVISVAVRL
jgi:hypothetical protein